MKHATFKKIYNKAQGKRLLRLAAVLILSVPALPAVTFAQSMGENQRQDIQNQLNRLENEIETLSRAVFKGQAPPLSQQPGYAAAGDRASASIEVRLSQIERDLGALTGKLEEQTYEIERMQRSIERLSARAAADDETAAASATTPSVSGQASASAPAPAPIQHMPIIQPASAPTVSAPAMPSVESAVSANPDSPTVKTLGTLSKPAGLAASPGTAIIRAAPTDVNPDELYDTAFSLLRERRYDEAETSFQGFLDRYPGHALASNARYWLGESFYARNNFERAARVFAEAYQQNPKGSKGPDSLLKLGMSLAGMGKTDDACLTYAQLRKDYAEGFAPVLTRAVQEMDKLGCK